jgi:hypothetical protein
VVTQDGGGFAFDTTALSPLTLTAEYGIEETLGQNLTRMTPLLLGVLRNVQPDPDKPVTNADIILDTHLDQTATATLVSLPEPAAGGTIAHLAGALLDLGSSGFVSVGQASASGTELAFTGLPLSAGQGLIFVDELVSGSAISIYLRRIEGEVLSGFTLGPYLPFPLVQSPPNGLPLDPSFDGELRWALAGGLLPSLAQVSLYEAGSGRLWRAILPGSSRAVALPSSVRAQLASGKTYIWFLTASYAPGFDFTYWNDNDLYGGTWTTFSTGNASFTVP